jgi:non-lysosomal glucosylceramidase
MSGGFMMFRRVLFAASCVLLLRCVPPAFGDDIPTAAWRRPIGQSLPNAGTSKPALGPEHIDDGYWQGAPVGGFGAGTFSRSYRGDFSRWHLQPGVHKFQTVYANQFAMFQKAEDETSGVAKVLFTGHPEGNSLKSWSWDYPVGAGDYAALYPKSWFDYRWDKFPAHVTLEQFSPVLPDNYKETSYPWRSTAGMRKILRRKKSPSACCFHGRTCSDGCADTDVIFAWD